MFCFFQKSKAFLSIINIYFELMCFCLLKTATTPTSPTFGDRQAQIVIISLPGVNAICQAVLIPFVAIHVKSNAL